MDIRKMAQAIIMNELPLQEKVQKLCFLVHEIPYARVGLSPDDMLEQGAGSCTPKHTLLAEFFEELGVPLKFLQMSFFFQKCDIDFPAGMKAVLEAAPAFTHTALRVELQGRWTIIDVTWDPALKGFPNNVGWDGESDMVLAVIPEEVREITVSRVADFQKQNMVEYTPDEMAAKEAFEAALDTFLVQARQ